MNRKRLIRSTVLTHHGKSPPRRLRTGLLVLLVPTLIVSFCVLKERRPTASPVTRLDTLEAAVDNHLTSTALAEPIRQILAGTLESGDTITTLLSDHLSTAEILEIDRESRSVFPLSRICAGHDYSVLLTDGSFERFEYTIDSEDLLVVSRSDPAFVVSRVPIDYDVTTVLVSGAIDSNLFGAIASAGETSELAIALSDIFAWDIDFHRDVRAGDAFRILVEKRYLEGEQAGYGRILAAVFTNQDRTRHAVRFRDGDNAPSYFDLEGKNLRKVFLSAPLAYSRISSGYSLRRLHPVTGKWKSHPGIDYAAPVGTPVKAVGDGRVIAKGYTKYNGRYVKLRHHNSFETGYLHLSAFGRGIKQGKDVVQGQIIGYVGATGQATGPHLCFRMTRNGRAVNPYRVNAPSAPPVSEENLGRFQTLAASLIAVMDSGEHDLKDHIDLASAMPDNETFNTLPPLSFSRQ